VWGEGLPLVLLAVGAQQGVRHHDPLAAAAAAAAHPLAHVGENAALEGGLQQPVQLLLRAADWRAWRTRARVSRSPPWQGRLLEASGKGLTAEREDSGVRRVG